MSFRALCTPRWQIADFIASLIGHGCLARHPRLKVAIVEFGTDYVRPMVHHFQDAYERTPAALRRGPDGGAAPQRVHPRLPEPDPIGLIELLGVDNTMWGSDFPHPEGMRDPLAFSEDDREPLARHAQGRHGRQSRASCSPTPEAVGRRRTRNGQLEDIRDTDKDQYWETLRQRWGALMSYRYIGRQFSSMNQVDDDTVTLRHDMRNAAGGILSQIFSISAPGGGGPSDLEVVPNPVIHSVQILDNGNDVKRIEVVDAGALKVGTRMYFGRATIVDADDHSRVLALIEGQGASIGDVPEHIKGDQLFEDDPIEHVEDSPDLPPIWQVFGGSQARPTGTGVSASCRPSSRRPTPRSTSVRSS